MTGQATGPEWHWTDWAPRALFLEVAQSPEHRLGRTCQEGLRQQGPGGGRSVP